MAGPITFPIGPIVKWGIRVAGPTIALWDSLHDQISSAPSSSFEWRRMTVKFTRETPTGTTEDAAYNTFDMVNFTDSVIDSSWTTADYTTAEARFDTYWNAVKVYFPATHVISEYRWYRRQFAAIQTMPDDRGRNGFLFEKSGPPVRITTKSIPGTSGAPAFPYQVAMSITERTSVPRHWGRWFIPGFCVALAPDGRWPSGAITANATAAGALMNGLRQDQLPLVVPAAQIDKQAAKWLLNVTSIQVDDVPDVQRRRRPRQPAVRTVVPLA